MQNKDVAEIFSQIADLLEIKGEKVFRVNSYRRAARTIKDLTSDIEQIAEQGKLDSLPGIGKSTAEKITEYLTDGTIAIHQELLDSIPAGLPALLGIPGLGPKRIALIWHELGVESLADLKAAIESGKLESLKGMGAKSVKQLAEAIEFAEQSEGRTPLGLAWPLALELAAEMRKVESVKRVVIAGSVRRGCETIGDIDLLCESAEGEAVVAAFTALPQVKRVLAGGKTKGSALVERRDGADVQVDCRVVPGESFGAALQYFTGSKEHNVNLRERAIKKGWKLNEWGLFDGEESIAGKEEPGIYTKLGLPAIPPEMREDRGELDLDELDPPIELTDIRGDLHLHTTESDGTADVAEMAEAAAALGYEYIAITDHSQASAIANGLSIDRMWRHIERIRSLNKEMDSITLLVGCECDILSDGRLDYPDKLLAACDLVVASIHMAMKQPRSKVTGRVLDAMASPYVHIIGHPTGRLINRREPMDLDMEAVINRARETNTALELNASWQRLDLKDQHARMAKEAGVMLAISTDAHSVAQFDQMKYGVVTARRAWVRPQDVLNTRYLPALREWIKLKHGA